MSGLNTQQKKFAAEYLIDGNGTQAAIRAGYSPKAAAQQASRLLKNPHVQRLVAKVEQQAINAAAEKLELSAGKLLQDLENTKAAALRDGQYAPVIRAIELQGKALKEGNPFADQPQKVEAEVEIKGAQSIDEIARHTAFLFAAAQRGKRKQPDSPASVN